MSASYILNKLFPENIDKLFSELKLVADTCNLPSSFMQEATEKPVKDKTVRCSSSSCVLVIYSDMCTFDSHHGGIQEEVSTLIKH